MTIKCFFDINDGNKIYSAEERAISYINLSKGCMKHVLSETMPKVDRAKLARNLLFKESNFEKLLTILHILNCHVSGSIENSTKNEIWLTVCSFSHLVEDVFKNTSNEDKAYNYYIKLANISNSFLCEVTKFTKNTGRIGGK